jgi:hypothetical protein
LKYNYAFKILFFILDVSLKIDANMGRRVIIPSFKFKTTVYETKMIIKVKLEFDKLQGALN